VAVRRTERRAPFGDMRHGALRAESRAGDAFSRGTIRPAASSRTACARASSQSSSCSPARPSLLFPYCSCVGVISISSFGKRPRAGRRSAGRRGAVEPADSCRESGSQFRRPAHESCVWTAARGFVVLVATYSCWPVQTTTISAHAKAASIACATMLRRSVSNARSIKEHGKSRPAAPIPATWHAATSVLRLSCTAPLPVACGNRAHLPPGPLPDATQSNTFTRVSLCGHFRFHFLTFLSIQTTGFNGCAWSQGRRGGCHRSSLSVDQDSLIVVSCD
jgi:hypothetical protein